MSRLLTPLSPPVSPAWPDAAPAELQYNIYSGREATKEPAARLHQDILTNKNGPAEEAIEKKKMYVRELYVISIETDKQDDISRYISVWPPAEPWGGWRGALRGKGGVEGRG